MPGTNRSTELGQLRCACASVKPGISVAPAPSMTVAPSLGTDVPPSALRTASTRFPLIDTSPANGAAPLPSKMRTLVNRIISEPHVEPQPDLTQALRRQPSRHTVDIPIGRRWVRTRRREGWSSKQGDRFVLIAEVAGENG